MKPQNETYLSDGVYVRDKGFAFELWTDREEGRHWMELDLDAIDALLRFIEKTRNVKITVEKRP